MSEIDTPAEYEPDGWQPIETAPKDGTTVIGYCRHEGIEKTWFSRRLERWSHLEHNQDTPQAWKPTHWMPLPKPPEVEP